MVNGELIESLSEIFSECEDGEEVISGNLVAMQGGVIIQLSSADQFKSIVKKASKKPGFIKVLDVAFYEEKEANLYNRDDLTGTLKHFYAYARDGYSSTWFRMGFTLDIEDESDEGGEEDGYLERYDHYLSDDEISYYAVLCAKDDSFSALTNKSRRHEFCLDKIKHGGDGDRVTQYLCGRVSELAENVFDLYLMPRVCKELKEGGLSEKEIAKSVNRSLNKVKNYLNTTSVISFVSEALAAYEKVTSEKNLMP